MSRAGRESGPEAKRREVEERVAAAAAQHATPAAPEIPPEAQVAFRAQQLHIRCKAAIVARYPSLWPGESIGAAIAEQWLHHLQQAFMQQAQAEQEALVTESGIVLPA